MRITFVLPYAGLAGGVRVVAIYAERLKQRGHEVAIRSTRYRWPGRRERAAALFRRTAMRIAGKREPSHLRGLDLDHRIVRHAPPLHDADVPDGDVVIATWWETAEWVAALSPSKGAKAYFIQHYEIHDGQPVERVKATWTLPLRKIVVAPWLADVAAREFGDQDVSIVPNAVDAEQFHAGPRCKQRVPTVGVMYSTKPYKGCDICLRAYELARRRIAALRLNAFGAEPIAASVPFPPTAAYELRPPQDRLRTIYASCDAWLFGSRTEGFGLPLLEAMACGTPVISTPAGAAPDLIGQGGGVLVGHDDPDEMAAAIDRVVCLPAREWETLSKRAREVATQYGWDDAADLFEAALRGVVEGAGAGMQEVNKEVRLSA